MEGARSPAFQNPSELSKHPSTGRACKGNHFRQQQTNHNWPGATKYLGHHSKQRQPSEHQVTNACAVVNGSLFYACELWLPLSGRTGSEPHVEDGCWSWAHLGAPLLCEVVGNDSVSCPVSYPAGPGTMKCLLLAMDPLVLWATVK